MADITLKGNLIRTLSALPKVGDKSPNFILRRPELNNMSLDDFKGKRVILNIFPSVDTDTCATSVRKFNEQAAGLNNTKVICVSRDLPFAFSRFCGAEGISNVECGSDISGDFARDFGVKIIDGPLEGLMSRAIIILDTEGYIGYTEQVSEITDEPDYARAIEALS